MAPLLTPVTQALSAYINSQVDWQPLTTKSHLTLLNIIREYVEETNTVWEMETLSNDAVTAWQMWLMKEKNYKNSTLGKQVKKLKQFLKNSPTGAPHVNLSNVAPIHEMRVSSAIVTITATEMAQLYRLDLSQSPRLERVRDLFILQCYTGLRYSDVIRLQRADISGGFIRLETQKVVDGTNIPLFTQAEAILEKYGYNLAPLAISNPKQNKYLKELLSLTSTLEAIPTLKREVKLPEERGTVRKYPTAPLYTVISTHCARKSFISACLEWASPRIW
ncbi:hypothetical protein ACFQT0_22015 [Hymenobacter humi]|uniref:Tyr recombinase domain-containing protein n=1 Tax=Hymenobacter humi TaxID=1411620 RepID=A0ABW2UBE6_9BACT